MCQAHTISNAISTISYDLPIPDVLLSHSIGHIEQKGDPKTCQKDGKGISVSFAKLPVSTESQQISRHSMLKAACFLPSLQAMTLTALRFRSRPRRSHQTGCAAALLVGFQAVKDL